jgi:isoleucyl-tRNA synthetase
MAPVSPFFAEWLYLNLNQATGKESFESVHLSRFPTEDALMRDDALEQRMLYAQKISSLILSLRKKENIRVRQPLKRVLLPVLDPDFKKQVLGVKDLIMSEVNIKDIEFITDTGGLIKKRIKPNFKTLGKRLGNQMKEASELIQKLQPDQIENIEKTGRFDLTIAGQNHELTLEDVVISSEDIPGWQVASEDDITVALDISLDSQLIAEGTARELVNRIQNIRKQRDFNVTDRIIVSLEDHESVMSAIEHFGDYIKDEVLAKDIQLMKQPGGEEVELLDGIRIRISLSLA